MAITPSTVNLIPGIGSDRERFVKYIQSLPRKHKMRLRDKLRDEAYIIVAALAGVTPRKTGAAAGRATGVPMTPKHPGYAMAIGNDPGDTGWQVRYYDHSDKITIGTPMWKPYLRYHEFGIVGNNAGFVRGVWQYHLQKRKTYRKYNKT